MATAAYLDDVFALVQELVQPDLYNSVAEAMTAQAPAPDALGDIEITATVYVESDQLRSAIAVQQALQLSIDAAAIAIEFFPTPGIRLSREDIEMILRDHIVELTIADLGAGSFRGRFKIRLRNENGGLNVLPFLGLAGIGLSHICPPIAIGFIIFGALRDINEILPFEIAPREDGALKSANVPDVTAAEVRLAVEPAGPGLGAAPVRAAEPQLYVYDVDLDQAANASFLTHVREVASVQRQSRFIFRGEPEYPRVRIWSSAPLDPEILRRLAAESGASIHGISEVHNP